MITYSIEVIVFHSVFLGAYLLFLRRETFFQYNRVYLLGTALLAFVLPFLEFDLFRTQVELPLQVKQLPAVLIGSPDIAGISENSSGFTISFFLLLIYVAGAAFSLWKFGRKYGEMQRFFRFKRKGDGNIINLPNSNDAFTFLNTVFLGEKIDAQSRKHILAHELVHAKQKHGLDLFFFELLRVVFWFNPLIYAYQRAIAELHEFIADAKAIDPTETKSYYNGLLNTAFGTQNISFINTFFNHSLTRLPDGQVKKRIVMLHKNSKNTAKWKYLLLIPIVTGMLAYASCSSDNNQVAKEGQTFEQQVADLQATIDTKDSLTKEEKKLLMDVISSGSTKNKNEKTKNSPSVVVEDISDDEGEIADVPFAVIEEVPTYPGCENLTDNEAKKTCMSDQISDFFNRNFDTSLGKKLGLTGVNKIYVQFKINENGNVKFMGARGPAPELEVEAERIVNLIPNLKPGRQRGQAVNVLYALPIVFQVQE